MNDLRFSLHYFVDTISWHVHTFTKYLGRKKFEPFFPLLKSNFEFILKQKYIWRISFLSAPFRCIKENVIQLNKSRIACGVVWNFRFQIKRKKIGEFENKGKKNTVYFWVRKKWMQPETMTWCLLNVLCP